MTTLFVRHQVADYAKWREVYDKFGVTQQALGVQEQAVYQSIDNPNEITVRHEFATLAGAKPAPASAPPLVWSISNPTRPPRGRGRVRPPRGPRAARRRLSRRLTLPRI